VVLFALSVIAVSIGIAQADTLTAMVDDETGRLALLGLAAVIVFVGSFTAMMMRLTAPKPARIRKLTRL
jgi:dipeptide/tripeptide permease